jgi:Trp operon repressor
MPPKPKSPPKAAPPKAMASIGQSKQTVQARAKQLKDGNAFLNYIETASEDGELATRWGTVWEEVSEEELGQRDIWAHLATYFVEVHRIEEGVKNAGEPLDINTAHGKWTGLINQARNALEHSTNAKAKVRCA